MSETFEQPEEFEQQYDQSTEWIQVWDPTSESYYYYNNYTGECQWEAPDSFGNYANSDKVGAVVRIQCMFRQLIAKRRAARVIVQQRGNRLSQGDIKLHEARNALSSVPWLQYYDSNSGAYYYVHRETGESTWDAPPKHEFVPYQADEAAVSAVLIQASARGMIARKSNSRRQDSESESTCQQESKEADQQENTQPSFSGSQEDGEAKLAEDEATAANTHDATPTESAAESNVSAEIEVEAESDTKADDLNDEVPESKLGDDSIMDATDFADESVVLSDDAAEAAPVDDVQDEAPPGTLEQLTSEYSHTFEAAESMEAIDEQTAPTSSELDSSKVTESSESSQPAAQQAPEPVNDTLAPAPAPATTASLSASAEPSPAAPQLPTSRVQASNAASNRSRASAVPSSTASGRWCRYFDARCGSCYYVHVETGELTYNKPAEYSNAAPGQDSRHDSATAIQSWYRGCAERWEWKVSGTRAQQMRRAQERTAAARHARYQLKHYQMYLDSMRIKHQQLLSQKGVSLTDGDLAASLVAFESALAAVQEQVHAAALLRGSLFDVGELGDSSVPPVQRPELQSRALARKERDFQHAIGDVQPLAERLDAALARASSLALRSEVQSLSGLWLQLQTMFGLSLAARLDVKMAPTAEEVQREQQKTHATWASKSSNRLPKHLRVLRRVVVSAHQQLFALLRCSPADPRAPRSEAEYVSAAKAAFADADFFQEMPRIRELRRSVSTACARLEQAQAELERTAMRLEEELTRQQLKRQRQEQVDQLEHEELIEAARSSWARGRALAQAENRERALVLERRRKRELEEQLRVEYERQQRMLNDRTAQEAEQRRRMLDPTFLTPWDACRGGSTTQRLEELLEEEAKRRLYEEGRGFHVDDIDPLTCERLLHLAAWGGHTHLIETLLQHGAEVDRVDNTVTRMTALHYAARAGRCGTALALMRAGADAAALDANGDTPLHWAARRNHYECVLTLLPYFEEQTPRDRVEALLQKAQGRPPTAASVRKFDGRFDQDGDELSFAGPLELMPPLWRAVALVNGRGRSALDVTTDSRVQDVLTRYEAELNVRIARAAPMRALAEARARALSGQLAKVRHPKRPHGGVPRMASSTARPASAEEDDTSPRVVRATSASSAPRSDAAALPQRSQPSPARRKVRTPNTRRPAPLQPRAAFV